MKRSRRLLAVAFIATAIALPGSALADDVGPSSAPKYGLLATSSTTGVSLVSGTASKRYRVWSVRMQNLDNTNGVQVSLYDVPSGACSGGTRNYRTPAWRLAPQSTIELPGGDRYPAFETGVTGSHLCVELSAARSTNIALTYTDFDPGAATYDSYQPVRFDGTQDVDVVDTAFGVNGEPIEVDCTNGCSGGAGGGDVTLTAIEGDAFTYIDEWREVVKWVGGLTVFLLIGLIVRGRFPKKDLPL